MPAEYKKFTPIQGCEIVGRGHPDKIADWVSGLCVDFVKSKDKNGRAAFETLIKGETFSIYGEYSTNHDDYKYDRDDDSHSYHTFNRELESFLETKLKLVGYEYPEFNFQLKKQSKEIAAGVDTGGAGDQGVIYNYATSDFNHSHPAATYLETLVDVNASLASTWDEVDDDDNVIGKHPRLNYHNSTPWIGSDFKALINFDPRNFKVQELTIAMLCRADNQTAIKEKLLAKMVERGLEVPSTFLFNAAGTFEVGGTTADAGATNRKLAVDTTYGLAPNGGGGLHGKDLTKVDVSATYYLRYVAIQLVELMKKVQHYDEPIEIVVGVTYAIGRSEITGLEVRLNGKRNRFLTSLAYSNFDFSPTNMATKWEIKSYADLATRNPSTNPANPWNKTDAEKVKELVEFYNANSAHWDTSLQDEY